MTASETVKRREFMAEAARFPRYSGPERRV